MLHIGKSLCKCGKCGNGFYIDWDIDVTQVNERKMGEEVYYNGESYGQCPECGQDINASLSFVEYPAGDIEGGISIEVDSETNASIQKPEVIFLDL